MVDRRDGQVVDAEDALDKVTATISVRVPARYKYMYMRLGPREKLLFKSGVMGLIEALYRGGSSSGSGGAVVVNINVNINENHAETRVNVDPGLLTEIRELAEYLYRLRRPLPPAQRETVEKLYRLVGRLRGVN